MPTPEQAFQAKVITYLDERQKEFKDIFIWRQNTGGASTRHKRKDGTTKRGFVRFGRKGCSDIIGMRKPNGQFLAIECKVGYEEQSDAQREFERDVRAMGGLYVLAYSLEDVKLALGTPVKTPT